MNTATEDRHSLILLVSLLAYLVLAAFLENHRTGERILIVLIFGILLAATLELSASKWMMWTTIPLVILSMVFTSLAHFYQTRSLLIVSYALLTVYFGFVSAGMFTYLGRSGSITKGRVFASASLYLILSLFWFSIYNLLEAVHPGSLAEAGAAQFAKMPRSSFLYFSMVTLTTLGYGDVVPVTPAARIFAALEAVTGVLYIAITVARLVAAYQRAENDGA
jgi:voltage-gated potassium channel Kch